MARASSPPPETERVRPIQIITVQIVHGVTIVILKSIPPRFFAQPRRVAEVHRVVTAEHVQVQAAREQDRVLGDPPPGRRVVPTRPEVYQTGVGIVQAGLEAERLKTGVGVLRHVPEGVAGAGGKTP